MFKTMSKNFWTSDSFGEKEEIKNTQFSKTMVMFSHWNTILAIITLVGLLMLPFVQGVREFPFKVYIPFLDVHEYPYFEIIMCWQWITGFWTVLCSIICYDYITVAFMTGSICQLKMLQCAIKSIGNNDNLQVETFLENAAAINKRKYTNLEDKHLHLLSVCIKHHALLSKYEISFYKHTLINFCRLFQISIYLNS